MQICPACRSRFRELLRDAERARGVSLVELLCAWEPSLRIPDPRVDVNEELCEAHAVRPRMTKSTFEQEAARIKHRPSGTMGAMRSDTEPAPPPENDKP